MAGQELFLQCAGDWVSKIFRIAECSRLVGRRHFVYHRIGSSVFFSRNDVGYQTALQRRCSANRYSPLFHPFKLLRRDCIAASAPGNTLFGKGSGTADTGRGDRGARAEFGRRLLASTEVTDVACAEIQPAGFRGNARRRGTLFQVVARRLSDHEFICYRGIADLFMACFQSSEHHTFYQRDEIQRLTNPSQYRTSNKNSMPPNSGGGKKL